MEAMLVCDRPMAKQKPGRPRKDVEMSTIRVESDVNELVREAAAIARESMVAYTTRVLREKAEADILANAERRIAELKGKTPKSKPE